MQTAYILSVNALILSGDHAALAQSHPCRLWQVCICTVGTKPLTIQLDMPMRQQAQEDFIIFAASQMCLSSLWPVFCQLIGMCMQTLAAPVASTTAQCASASCHTTSYSSA